ncbi:MAG: aminotransferase class I/II-fold pyridoxal phosphate-dependent enzyme [Thermoleophilia bacterium]|nr:aminotransferase class I/II-fold pyridoxal phosphate-dependent enzyme [Thermoleophilia bacterium]
METPLTIDMFSDTVTRPSDGMRAAMAAAEVGDEQLFEDPTTSGLQRRVAELLSKAAAVFMPSGIMCNLAAYSVHCRPGDEIVLDQTAHPVHFEVGGVAAIVGAQLRTVTGTRGVFTEHDLGRAIRHPEMRNNPHSRVVSIEQTTNLGGGAVWTLDQVAVVAGRAREHNMIVHIDGARLLNAVAASGTSAERFAAHADTIWIDFSKGLGAPVGAVLAGSEGFIHQAWKVKQRLGGAMRQSGVIAAAALYALDHNVDRLAEDHAAARAFADIVATSPGVALDPTTVETNIVIFDIAPSGRDAAEVVAELRARHGVRLSHMGGTTLRAVAHLDVTTAQSREAAEGLVGVLT